MSKGTHSEAQDLRTRHAALLLDTRRILARSCEGMSDRPLPVVACGVAIIRREREFLICQRKAGDTFGSLWEFPGGRKNRSETLEDCVAREVMEELGVRVRVHEKFMEMRHKFPEYVIWLNFFLCSHVDGEPAALDCANVAWVDIGALTGYQFSPSTESVIDKLRELVG